MIDFWINNKQFISPVFFGLVLIIIGFYRNYKIDTIRKEGISTTAEIIDYVGEVSYTDGLITKYYYPVIRFTDCDGIGRQIVDKTFGTSPKPNKKLPFRLKIHYKENNGEFEVITESNSNDIIAMGVLIIGLIMVASSIFLFFNR